MAETCVCVCGCLRVVCGFVVVLSRLPVLEPDLNHPHVEPQRLRELFPNVAGGFGAVFVGLLELLQLAG